MRVRFEGDGEGEVGTLTLTLESFDGFVFHGDGDSGTLELTIDSIEAAWIAELLVPFAGGKLKLSPEVEATIREMMRSHDAARES